MANPISQHVPREIINKDIPVNEFYWEEVRKDEIRDKYTMYNDTAHPILVIGRDNEYGHILTIKR